jgi:hypothetical protein
LIAGEIVLVVGLGAVLHAQTIVEILNWLAGHARANLRTIARLAIQVARETLICDGIWVVTQGALGYTIGSIPLLLLKDDHITHIEGGIVWTSWITTTLCEERKTVDAHDTVLVCNAATELACLMAANVSNLNVFVPL